jgi:hypothetical protein
MLRNNTSELQVASDPEKRLAIGFNLLDEGDNAARIIGAAASVLEHSPIVESMFAPDKRRSAPASVPLQADGRRLDGGA